MRRFALGAGIFLAAALAASPMWAQNTRLGIKGGVASSTVYGDAVADDSESLTRFSAGASLELPVGPMVSIQPEVLFSLKGSRVLGEDAGDMRLSYIEIPVLAKVSFGTGAMRPSIFGGPAVAFKTGCEIEFVGASEAVECDSDVADVVTSRAPISVRSWGQGSSTDSARQIYSWTADSIWDCRLSSTSPTRPTSRTARSRCSSA